MTGLLFTALELDLCFVCIKQGCHVNLSFLHIAYYIF